MKWDHIVPNVDIISITAAKEMLLATSSHTLQVVDVRQPEEYTESHLPGALSVPLYNLTNGEHQLKPDQPLMLYCSNGERSNAAASWLDGNGFKEVFIIAGGIDAWDTGKAFGHYDLNLNLLEENAEFPDALSMAFAMEEGMRQFYILLAKETSDPMYKELFRELAGYEVLHKKEISGKYFLELGQSPIQEAMEKFEGQLIEGGGLLNHAVIRSLANAKNILEIFSLSIAFETQAFDFYYRLALKTEQQEVKNFFLDMADAEKKHLHFVSKKLDSYLNNSEL